MSGWFVGLNLDFGKPQLRCVMSLNLTPLKSIPKLMVGSLVCPSWDVAVSPGDPFPDHTLVFTHY